MWPPLGCGLNQGQGQVSFTESVQTFESLCNLLYKLVEFCLILLILGHCVLCFLPISNVNLKYFTFYLLFHFFSNFFSLVLRVRFYNKYTQGRNHRGDRGDMSPTTFGTSGMVPLKNWQVTWGGQRVKIAIQHTQVCLRSIFHPHYSDIAYVWPIYVDFLKLPHKIITIWGATRGVRFISK